MVYLFYQSFYNDGPFERSLNVVMSRSHPYNELDHKFENCANVIYIGCSVCAGN